MSIYQGDPALIITENGSDLKFTEGQPVMDQGFENAVLIALFTKKNWAGNALFRDENQKIGSDFEDLTKDSITLDRLNDIRTEARNALKGFIDSGEFKDVEVTVTNPSANNIMVKIRITPPNGDAVDLTLENFGPNWRFQKNDPAHKRLE